MDKKEQRIVTYCYPQKSNVVFDFSPAIAKTSEDLMDAGWTIKQVSTTSFVKDSLIHMAYTLLIER